MSCLIGLVKGHVKIWLLMPTRAYTLPRSLLCPFLSKKVEVRGWILFKVKVHELSTNPMAC